MSHRADTGVADSVTARGPIAAEADNTRHCPGVTHRNVGRCTNVRPAGANEIDIAENGNCASARCAKTAAAGSTTPPNPGGGTANHRGRLNPSGVFKHVAA
jgi:hypothetical protein